MLRELAGTVAVELERGALAAELEIEHGPARPRLRRGRDRQLRLGPGHERAALGRPADGAVRLHAARRSPSTSTRSARGCTTTTARPSRPRSRAPSSSCGEYEADYRVVHPDGSVRWVAARGRVLCDPEGRPVRMLGAAYDTTDVHSAAEHLGRVLETMSTAFITLDREWRFTYVNAAAERIFDRGRDRLVGHRLRDVHPELESALDTGRSVSFQQFYAPLDAVVRRARDAEPGRRERLLPRHHRSGPGRARARGGDRAAADPRRRRRAAGGHARGRRAARASWPTSCSTASARAS